MTCDMNKNQFYIAKKNNFMLSTRRYRLLVSTIPKISCFVFAKDQNEESFIALASFSFFSSDLLFVLLAG